MSKSLNLYIYFFLVVLMAAGLLTACGGENGTPLPSNLEVINAATSNLDNSATTGPADLTASPALPVQASPTAATEKVAPATAQTTTGSNTITAPQTATSTLKVGISNNSTATTAPAIKAPVATAIPPKPSPTNPSIGAAAAPNIKKGVLLEPMAWEAQTWNNCAPMSALMAFSYYGVKVTQVEAGLALRPNGGDKNVALGDKHVEPGELAGYVESKGFKTKILDDGSLNTIRALLSAGIPVIMQQWLKDGDDIAHYRVARGYDLATDVFIFNDSMDRKPNTVVSSAEEDRLWKAFDRRYFPVYPPSKEAAVLAILGKDADPSGNLNRAFKDASEYARTNPNDIDAWRNLGYLNFALGNYRDALNVWEQHLTKMLSASDNGPYNRFLWYQLWPMVSYNKVGNYQQVIKMAPNEIEKAKIYAEVRYEYAFALVNIGRKDEAVKQLKMAVGDDKNYQPTYSLLSKLGVS